MDFEARGGWPYVLGRLTGGHDLTAAEAAGTLDQVLEGRATSAQIAAFAVALRMKGESIEELTGLVASLVEHGGTVVAPAGVELVDTCGTGGDRSHSINVSTISALVVAGAGAVVCKHGNRAASSAAGSADVLEALGVTIDLGPQGVAQCLERAGLAFCFAPRFHPALRHAGPTRRELGVATVFNFLGPLVNPARPHRQIVGVSDPAMAAKMAGALAAQGATRALVVYGHDGLDELTTTTTSTVVDLHDGELRTYDVDPSALGIPHASREQLRGGGAAANADALRRILDGDAGPQRDVVILNAGAAMVAAGLAADIAEGLDGARSSVDDGHAASALERLVAASKAATSE